MTPEQQVQALFDAVLELTPSQRNAYLEQACANDKALLQEVATLLAADARADPLSSCLPSPSVVAPGQRVKAYRILSCLGAGGMGTVYKALDTRLERLVVLKFLQPHLNSNQTAKQRFILEAKAASALDHPNICTIYDIDETADGHLFIVMAFYDGESLEQRLAHGSLPVAEALTGVFFLCLCALGNALTFKGFMLILV